MSNKNKSSGKAHNVTAFLVAAPLEHTTNFSALGLPLALLPLANRPVIDYAIENIIRNGIHKIYVLCSAKDTKQITDHVSKAWTNVVHGGITTTTSLAKNSKKSPTSPYRIEGAGGEIEYIEVRTCPLENGCFDVISHIKHNNLIRDNEYFIVTSLDNVNNISNLSQLVSKAIQNHIQHKFVLTAVARQDDGSLRKHYERVMANELYRLHSEKEEDENPSLAALQTPFVSQKQWDDQPDIDEDLSLEKPYVDRCTIAFDPATGMIQALKKWAEIPEDELETYRADHRPKPGSTEQYIEAPHEPLEPLPIKRNGPRLSVRTDLMITGILICSADVLTASLNAYQKSVLDFLREFISSQIEWNLDIAIDIANNTSVVCPLTSLEAYLTANRLVSARYLHPMTRDSNFGNYVDVKYGTSRRAPLVSVPEKGCPFLRCTVEGSAVFGLDVIADESSYVSNSSILDNCVVGRNVSIVNSVIGRNVTIKSGAIISNSFILDNTTVPENLELEGVMYGLTDPYNTKAFVNRKKTCYNGVFINDAGAQSDLPRSEIIATNDLFTSDNIGGRKPNVTDWRDTLWNSYLNNPAVGSDALVIGLKDFRLSASMTNCELIQAMFEVLMLRIGDAAREHYLETRESPTDEEEENEEDDDEGEDFVASWEFVRNQLIERLLLWNSVILWDFISLGDTGEAEFIINGLCIGIAKRPCLQPLGAKIFNVFYCTLDEELFDKRQFCILSGPAIIRFLENQEKREELAADRSSSDQHSDRSSESDDDSDEDTDDSDDDDDQDAQQENIRKGWTYFAGLAEKVRAAFEEDDDDDDNDEDDDDDDESDEDEEEEEN